MRAYADTSFLGKLLTQEPGTRAAVADYRRLGRPPVFFLPLHDLEVANAIRQRAFHQRNTTPSAVRSALNRERDTSLALLQKYISRRAFIEISQDMDTSIELARKLSVKHTECLGCRGFDLHSTNEDGRTIEAFGNLSQICVQCPTNLSVPKKWTAVFR